MFEEYSKIPREAKLLVYLNFVPSIAIGFIYTDLSYFLTKAEALSAFWSGATITTMGATLVVASIPLGILADRYGRRKMVVLGNLCASLSLIGFALTNDISLILLTAVLEGTGEAAFAVSVGALLADKAGDSSRTSAFSLLAFTGWTAASLGSFLIASVAALTGLGLSELQAHVALFIAVGVLSLSVTPFVFKIGESSRQAPKEGKRGILPRKSGRILAKYSVYSVMIALGAGLFVPLMTLWFSKAYGVSDSLSGPVLGVTSALTAVAVFLSPRLARRAGTVKAIVMTQAGSMLFMVAVPVSPDFGVAATLYAVRVFMMNLSNPLTQSLIMGLVAPDERGMASGISASLWRLPNSFTTLVGASFIGAGLLALPFYIATVLYAVGITLLWVLFRNAKLPEESRASVGSA